MPSPHTIVHPATPRPIAVRRHAGVPALIACVLALQQRTAMVLAVLGPRGDTAAADLLRRLHAQLALDAQVLTALLEVRNPSAGPATTKDPS